MSNAHDSTGLYQQTELFMNTASELETPVLHRTVRSIRILGVRIDNITPGDALDRISGMALSGIPHHVMTVNPEFIMMAKKDPLFGSVLEKAALCLADGIGIVAAARLMRKPIGGRITGSDTIPALAAIAARKGISIFLLGAAPGVAERASETLRRANPGLNIVGTYSGSPRPEEEDGICRMIENVRPQILLVAFGAPGQDLWIARTQERLRIPVAIGVGGTFDFIAGVVKRAPRWMQSLGLEWFYRLIREPRRWRRMLALPRFASAVIQRILSPETTETYGK
jgi:N-acetylglucosaminyldiphosphoundecaprenol N-acetyl-beta-D-mannosaminyltransferase